MRMHKLKEKLRQSCIINFIYYGCHVDNLIYSFGLFGFDAKKKQAINKWLPDTKGSDKLIKSGIFRDMNECYKKYKCNPNEYFLFDFRNKSNEERATYVTDTYINSKLARIVGRKQHDEQLNDKYGFYCLMKPYFRRDVMVIKDTSDWSAFERFATSVKHLIIKPNNASIGVGIKAVDVLSSDDAKQQFSDLLKMRGGVIVEQKIEQSKEMGKWNKSSTNTIRLSTFLTKEGFFVLSSILRTGRAGSVVDNAGRGGISAAIDPETGFIISDGIDKSGNLYLVHPDSKIGYKGIQLPRWGELLQLAEEIHRNLPNQIYVGWDFALTDEGWVLIEGNWGELGAQQVALGHGLKPQFNSFLDQGRKV